MNRYFTRSGDDGYTGVLGEGRLPKNHPRIEAIGSVDEATAVLGLARTMCQLPKVADVILTVQRDLYAMMAEVAALPEHAARFRTLNADQVSWLEQQIEDFSTMVDMPHEFIVPGNSPAGAFLDLARASVRRAERRLVELSQRGEIDNPNLIGYINRLSSLCYILEGVEDTAAGKGQFTLAKK